MPKFQAKPLLDQYMALLSKIRKMAVAIHEISQKYVTGGDLTDTELSQVKILKLYYLKTLKLHMDLGREPNALTEAIGRGLAQCNLILGKEQDYV